MGNIHTYLKVEREIHSALGMLTLNLQAIVFLGERENNKNCNTSNISFSKNGWNPRPSQIETSGFETANYNVAENVLSAQREEEGIFLDK